MSKQIQKPAKAQPDKRVKASPTPALLTALALLSVSLRITDGTLAEESANTAGVKLADKITTLARASQLAANHEKSMEIHAISKTKKLVVKPSNTLQSNQHKSPAPSNRHK